MKRVCDDAGDELAQRVRKRAHWVAQTVRPDVTTWVVGDAQDFCQARDAEDVPSADDGLARDASDDHGSAGNPPELDAEIGNFFKELHDQGLLEEGGGMEAEQSGLGHHAGAGPAARDGSGAEHRRSARGAGPPEPSSSASDTTADSTGTSSEWGSDSSAGEQRVLGPLEGAPDWQEILDTSTMEVYFWNRATNDVRWQPPPGGRPRRAQPPAGRASDETGATSRGAESPADVMEGDRRAAEPPEGTQGGASSEGAGLSVADAVAQANKLLEALSAGVPGKILAALPELVRLLVAVEQQVLLLSQAAALPESSQLPFLSAVAAGMEATRERLAPASQAFERETAAMINQVLSLAGAPGDATGQPQDAPGVAGTGRVREVDVEGVAGVEGFAGPMTQSGPQSDRATSESADRGTGVAHKEEAGVAPCAEGAPDGEMADDALAHAPSPSAAEGSRAGSARPGSITARPVYFDAKPEGEPATESAPVPASRKEGRDHKEAQPLYRRAKKPMAGKAAALIQKWRAVSTSGSPDE